MKMMGKERMKFKKQPSKTNGRRRVAAVLLAAALAVTSLWAGAPLNEKEAYASSDWASSYLQNLVEQGVLKGDPDGTLNPDRDITRAEFAAMLNRAFGFHDIGTKQTSFSDVTPDSWYRNDIAIAANQGYFQGTSSSTANPNGKLTREEAVAMICRAIKIDQVPTDPLKFTDSEDFQNWSRGYINAATQKGFVSGYSDGTFRPAASITRGEVAKMLSDVAGTIVRTPSQVNLGYVNGNVSLTQSGSGLRNTTISGDLYITEGVGLGYVYLDNVTVLGDVIISGAGQGNKGDSSVVADGCNFKNVIVNVGKDKTLSLVAQGDTVIDNTVVKSNAYLEENNVRKSAFNNVQLKGPDNTKLDLSGTFKEVRVMSPKNQLVLGKGTIEQLTVDEYGPDSSVYLEKNTNVQELYTDVGAKVTGTGSISSLNVTSNGTNVAQTPDEIIIRPGVSATVNGQQMGSVDADQSNETPKVRSGYPDVNGITPNSAQGKVMVNKPGELYWMVKKGDDSSPSQEEMKNPTGAKDVVSSGKTQVTDADKEIQNQLGSLKPGESYEFYVMLEDSKGALSRIRSDAFQTVDNTKPQFVQSYPKAEAMYGTAVVGEPDTHMIKVSLVSNKDVSVNWALMKKGDPAPTVDMVAAQNLPNAFLKGVNTGIKKDTLKDILILGDQKDQNHQLMENTAYDIYICLKDNSGNISTLSKLSVTTKDVTPPDFAPGYPKMGAIMPTSVNIEYQVSEASKLHWMVCQENSPFPPGVAVPDTSTTEGGILNTDTAKQAVVTGNGAYKGLKGTQTAAMDQFGSFPINGLEAQKVYDLYMVLQDQAGNLSAVTKMKITTQDDIPPSAEMLFDGIGEGGQPPVGSKIRIQFSETVYGVSQDENGKLERTLLSEVPHDQMGDYIRLYDISGSKPVEVPIRFENVTYLDNNGKTVMVFTSDDKAADPSATPSTAISLKSGSRYQFELTDISDLTGNVMPKTQYDGDWDGGKYVYPLKEFSTQAPYIDLRQATVPSKDYDLGYEIEPKILNAGDTLCYDSVLECNRRISFDLYVKTDGSDTMEKLNVKKQDDGTVTPFPLNMEPGKYYLIQDLLGKGDRDNYLKDAKFNDLKKKQYYIHLITVDNSDKRTSWNGEINMTVRGVAGEPEDMRALSYKGLTSGKFDTDIAQPGVNAKQVSNPTSIVIPVYFIDSDAPVFLDKTPTGTAVDVVLQMNVKLDKAGKVYWLLAPEDTVTSTPNAIDLENQVIHPAGSQTGVIDVTNGNVAFTTTISNLTPKAKYDFYYVAKGVNAFSPVGKVSVTMTKESTPVWAGGFPNSVAYNETTVKINARLDNATAQIAWAAYPAGTYPTSPPSITEITNAQPTPGSGVAAAGKEPAPMGKEISFDVTGLKSGEYYDFYATAINSLLAGQDVADSNWTQVQIIKNISPKDLMPPSVVKSCTTIQSYSNEDSPRPLFTGILDVTFSEPLYYRESVTAASVPLTVDLLDVHRTDSPKLEIIGGGSMSAIHVTPVEVNGKQLVKGFVLEFNDVSNGTIVQFPRIIADQTNVVPGDGLLLKFTLRKSGTKDDGFKGTAFTPQICPDQTPQN